MAKVLDWKKSEDVRDFVHLSVQALAEGHLIALPTCTCYYAVASAIDENAVARLNSLLKRNAASPTLKDSVTPPASLVVRGPREICDYSPTCCSTAMRLAARVWPGPLQLLLPGDHPDSLAVRLSEGVRELVCTKTGLLSLCMPAHSAINEISRLSAGPLLALPLFNRDGSLAITAEMVDSDAVAMVIDGGATKYQGQSTVLNIQDNQCQIVRSGVSSMVDLQSVSRLVVLLVCTGNTCRSPMAEKLLEYKIGQKMRELSSVLSSKELKSTGNFIPIVALSAGIASGGGPASPQAIAAMSERGLDLSSHQSCAVTQKEIESADIILAMTRSHLQAIISRWPEMAGKTHLISGSDEDLSDPFGGPVQLYRDCAEKLDVYLDKWIDRLMSSPLPSWIES